ncbi:MAG: DNA repair protein RadA [Marinifilaceae bacterium]|jgi:DNA repair protein RadA/Sms|nr:DNA repair protein RadA [Marinifilaceae bacterium]
MKVKTTYVCQNCGAQSPKWVGKCQTCGEWNTYVEEIVEKKSSGKIAKVISQEIAKPTKIKEINSERITRFSTTNKELDRVLGGGLVPGSLTLIGGEPGIGKSTLVLQVALQIKKKMLYVSGEESLQQIKLRADRLASNESDCLLVSETSLENILMHIDNEQPDVVVVDSIQTISTNTLESAIGSVGQIRECSSKLMRHAKENNIAILLIGHITKDGHLAGPKVLEHMVDTVLQFEGDQNYMYRILRSIKNRFGSTSEIGIYEMRTDGLREVSNPSELLLSGRDDMLSGTAVSATIEGIRPILIEVQALVSSAAYGTPQRSVTGFDLRRLNMLLAVLEKRVGFRLAVKDVFLNIAGGIKVSDPAIDLAVVMAVLSSNVDIVIPQNVCFAGEVGLSGEIRSVSKIDQRIAEAEKLGFSDIYIPANNYKAMNNENRNIKIHQAKRVSEVFKSIFS